ncbi:MAG: imelysin family protein [Pseudomonadota bacterium]
MSTRNTILVSLLILAISAPVLYQLGSPESIERRGITPKAVVENHVRMAHALYSASLTKAEHLLSSVETLIATPSQDTLNQARKAYRALRIPYQQSEIMRWDSDFTAGRSVNRANSITSVDEWEGQVNAWPLDEGLIDYVAGEKSSADLNVIASDRPLTTENIIALNGINNNEANVATGIHAIEFLLWGQDLNETRAGAGSRPFTDYDINNCSNQHCDRRAQYLLAVTQLLVSDLTRMVSEWDQTAMQTSGTLAHNVLNHPHGVDYIVGAMRSMATDELASARMASALMNNDTEEEHDCFSDLSHLANYYNFIGVKNAFYGDYGDVTGVGVADLLKQQDSAVFEAIDEALSLIESDMSQLLLAGERSNPVRFDQVIGQDKTGPERIVAERAVTRLINLSQHFDRLHEALSLSDLALGGDGD